MLYTLVLVSLLVLPILSTDQSVEESVIHSLPPIVNLPHTPYSPTPLHNIDYSPTPHYNNYSPTPRHDYSPSPYHNNYSPTPHPDYSHYPIQHHGLGDAFRIGDNNLLLPHLVLPGGHQPGPVAPHAPVHLGHPHHQPILTHHHLKEYHPYQYDISKIPECAFTNQQYYNLTFCLQDDYYPVDTIKHELERNKPLVDRILSDITYQSADNLVDGLTKVQEEGYTYQHYYGSAQHRAYPEDYQGYSHSPDYYKSGGYICPSDIFYGRPKRAVNTYGKWKVVVNLPDEYYAQGYGAGYEAYTQTQRLEQCMYPGSPCSFIDPAFHSACIQKHNFVRLLAYTYEEGLHIDSFKLPISCSCHLNQLNHYSPYTLDHGYSYPAPTTRHLPPPHPHRPAGPTHHPPFHTNTPPPFTHGKK